MWAKYLFRPYMRGLLKPHRDIAFIKAVVKMLGCKVFHLREFSAWILRFLWCTAFCGTPPLVVNVGNSEQCHTCTVFTWPGDISGLFWRALTDHKKQEHQKHENEIDQAEFIHFCSFIFLESRLHCDHNNLNVHMMRGDANHFSPLVFTLRMSVLLSSPELRRQVVPNIVRCGHGRCSALLCSLATESRPRRIQLYNTWCRNAVILYWSTLLNECGSFQLRSSEKTRENVIYSHLKDLR